jgi:hypothetical protein
MLKIFAILLSVLTASCQSTRSASEACQSLDGGFRVVGRSYSVGELEAIGKAFAAQNPAVPQVPFAYANRRWNHMKSLMQPGDTLREFDNPMVGPGLPTPDGYVLMRGQCVIAMLGLVTS